MKLYLGAQYGFHRIVTFHFSPKVYFFNIIDFRIAIVIIQHTEVIRIAITITTQTLFMGKRGKYFKGIIKRSFKA